MQGDISDNFWLMAAKTGWSLFCLLQIEVKLISGIVWGWREDGEKIGIVFDTQAVVGSILFPTF